MNIQITLSPNNLSDNIQTWKSVEYFNEDDFSNHQALPVSEIVTNKKHLLDYIHDPKEFRRFWLRLSPRVAKMN